MLTEIKRRFGTIKLTLTKMSCLSHSLLLLWSGLAMNVHMHESSKGKTHVWAKQKYCWRYTLWILSTTFVESSCLERISGLFDVKFLIFEFARTVLLKNTIHTCSNIFAKKTITSTFHHHHQCFLSSSLLHRPLESVWPRVQAWCDPKGNKTCCNDAFNGTRVMTDTAMCRCERQAHVLYLQNNC